MIPPELVPSIVAWGEANRRELPWRRTRDPWAVLVSEVMLQQTQVSRVLDRYEVFLERFPTPSACAEAPAADVIELWSGLGYNRRAVNLWRAAVTISDDFDGRFPEDLDELLSLPGVGPYTARALLAFAFEQDVGVVDTNVGRLLARWRGRPLTAKQAQILADQVVPRRAGWNWNQTLFDFANAVCTKRDPRCDECPVQDWCAWAGRGVDPALGSAGVSGRQSSFEGSDRQVRGRIVELLRAGPSHLGALQMLGREGDTEADIAQLVEGLVRDGLIAVDGDEARLVDGR